MTGVPTSSQPTTHKKPIDHENEIVLSQVKSGPYEAKSGISTDLNESNISAQRTKSVLAVVEPLRSDRKRSFGEVVGSEHRATESTISKRHKTVPDNDSLLTRKRWFGTVVGSEHAATEGGSSEQHKNVLDDDIQLIRKRSFGTVVGSEHHASEGSLSKRHKIVPDEDSQLTSNPSEGEAKPLVRKCDQK
jgi:hypothetical protein